MLVSWLGRRPFELLVQRRQERARVSVLIVSQSRLVARGIAAVAGQFGLLTSIVALEEAESTGQVASLVVFHCERWDRNSEDALCRLCTSGAPTVVVSSIADEPTRTAMLRVGALDFVPAEKLEELGQKALNFSRISLRPSMAIPLGPARYVDVLNRRIVSAGITRDLADTELRLLMVLYESFRARPGQPMLPEILASRLWGSASARTKTTLRSHINNLRDKIEQDPDEPMILLSRRNEGYWLNLTNVRQAESMPKRVPGRLPM